jgi:hypothetical protein
MRYPVLLACVFFMPLVAFAGPLSTPAPSAPAFDLPLIGDQGYLRSADLFYFYQHTFLVFWDSGCPHCVESLVECEEFFDQHGGENITVVGIQTGQSDPFEVEQLLETNEIRARQLWDIGGETARAYSIAPATVTVVLVDHDGRIVDRRSPSDGKFNEVMLRMMRDADASSPASAPEDPAVAADGEGASTSWANASASSRSIRAAKIRSVPTGSLSKKETRSSTASTSRSRGGSPGTCASGGCSASVTRTRKCSGSGPSISVPVGGAPSPRLARGASRRDSAITRYR